MEEKAHITLTIAIKFFMPSLMKISLRVKFTNSNN